MNDASAYSVARIWCPGPSSRKTRVEPREGVALAHAAVGSRR